MPYPAWKEMTDEEKFDFLHQWCENLSRSVQQQGAWIQHLHERLRAVEAKAGGTA